MIKNTKYELAFALMVMIALVASYFFDPSTKTHIVLSIVFFLLTDCVIVSRTLRLKKQMSTTVIIIAVAAFTGILVAAATVIKEPLLINKMHNIWLICVLAFTLSTQDFFTENQLIKKTFR